jgi:hypothetical protein
VCDLTVVIAVFVGGPSQNTRAIVASTLVNPASVAAQRRGDSRPRRSRLEVLGGKVLSGRLYFS